MSEPVQLTLHDSSGNPLRHKYLCQDVAAEGLFFQLPGDQYGADGPLLYFPGRLLFSAGWDTFSMSYGYQSAGVPFTPAHIPDIVEECAAALASVLKQRSYARLALAGKSLGAAVVAVLATMEFELENGRAIYLTPPLGTPVFDPVFVEAQFPAFLALGTADRFYDEGSFGELREAVAFEFALVEKADHSLYIEADLGATLRAHERVTRDVVAFAQA